MIELIVLLVTLLGAGILVSPMVARLPAPAWYQRARERGRPGIPVVAVVGALTMMGILWLIGERRGVLGLIVLGLWLAAPLTAFFVVRTWFTDRRSRRVHRSR